MISGNTTTADIQLDESVDANVKSTTTPLLMGDAKNASFYVVANTGTNAAHIATMQVSPDGANWFDTDHTVEGIGNEHDMTCIAESVRVKITTIEGATSTVDITVIIK